MEEEKLIKDFIGDITMDSVLILGGAGYLGSRLTQTLLKENYKVCVFDKCLYGRSSLISFVCDENFSFIDGDVRDDEVLINSIKKFNIIINLASLVGATLCNKNPIDAFLTNHRSAQIIKDNLSKEQVLLFNNTNSGYGQTDGKSMCTEESPLTPISLYGKTKCAAEELTREHHNHLIFRLATIFGASQRPRTDLLINNLVLKALKDKSIVLYESSFMRNYLYIQDYCDAVIFSLKNWEKVKNKKFNLGNDSINCSKLDLVKKIQEHIPCEIIKAEINSDKDMRNYIVSSQKFYNNGFKCSYDLDYGIKELIKMYELIDVPVNANY